MSSRESRPTRRLVDNGGGSLGGVLAEVTGFFTDCRLRGTCSDLLLLIRFAYLFKAILQFFGQRLLDFRRNQLRGVHYLDMNLIFEAKRAEFHSQKIHQRNDHNFFAIHQFRSWGN